MPEFHAGFHQDDLTLAFLAELAHRVVAADDDVDETEEFIVGRLVPAERLHAAGFIDDTGKRTDRYQEALELINRARAAAPDNAAIIDSYGWVLYRLGRNEEALTELRRAYALQKDAEIAAHVGEVLWVMGRRDEARRYFDEAREIDPDNRALKRALEKTGA